MRKIIYFILIIVFISGCAVTSEKYRYKVRFDNFYFLLNDSEKQLFASNKFQELGDSLKARLSNDKSLKEKWHSMQVAEAIYSFSPYETAKFFREIILRELNRENFYYFMNLLDSSSQIAFAKDPSNFLQIFEKYYNQNTRFRHFVENLKTEYRLYGFSHEAILKFFRYISFPEVSRREFYYILKLLKSSQALNDFKAGNISEAVKKLDSYLSIQRVASDEWQRIKVNSSFTKLSSNEILEIYYNVIMKEMDADAVKKTLAKF